MACASGGILAELLHDADFRLHPLTERDAEEMIASLRGAALLKGHRGAAPADVAALKDVLLRVSALVTACPEIQELDINPLRVMPRGRARWTSVCASARLVCRRAPGALPTDRPTRGRSSRSSAG